MRARRTWLKPIPKYPDHMVFQVASTNINESVDYNGDELSRYFEDKFNFEWDIISLPTENSEEKIRVWINAGNMPEVVIGGSYKSGEMMNYIDQELLYRFPDDWKERWPNAAKAFELTSLGDAVANQAGGTYIFPRAIFASNYPAEKVVPHYLAYLRKDWAEAVGFPLKDAYKTSELMEYARLIKEKDPGNVGSRLVPMAIRPIFNSYTFTLPNNAYAGRRGHVLRVLPGRGGPVSVGPRLRGHADGPSALQAGVRRGPAPSGVLRLHGFRGGGGLLHRGHRGAYRSVRHGLLHGADGKLPARQPGP